MRHILKVCIMALSLIGIWPSDTYASRLFSMIADEGYYLSNNSNPDDDNFFLAVNSLGVEFRSQGDEDHPDGWGMINYADDGNSSDPIFITKINSEDQASTDLAYPVAVADLLDDVWETTTIMAHVRRTSSGADSIPNPHPWYKKVDGQYYNFIHNGTIHNRTGLKDLIGTYWIDYFGGLNTFGNGPWDQEPGWSAVVDSELFFFWLLKNIVLEDYDIIAGLHKALADVGFDNVSTYNGEDEHLNFILSNGNALWAYKRAGPEAYPNNPDRVHTLYYSESDIDVGDNHIHMKSVASQPTHNSAYGVWIELQDYDLVYIPRSGGSELYASFIASDKAETKSLTKNWNWVGFPVLEETIGTPLADVFEYLAPNGQVLLSASQSSNYDPTSGWNNNFDLTGIGGYKVQMSATLDNYSLRTVGESTPIDETITLQAGENWVNYYLDETKHPWDAIPTGVKDRLTSIRGQHWYMYKFKGQWYGGEPPGCDGPEPDESCILFRYGLMYILTVSTGPDIDLTWQSTQALPRGTSVTATSFEVNELPDYSALVVETVEDPETVEEIGVFIDNECIGAEVVDTFPVYMQVYNGDRPLENVSFQIVRESALGKGIVNSGGGVAQRNMIHEDYDLSHLQRRSVDAGFSVSHAILEKSSEPLTSSSSLVACYPNPFNPSTTLLFEIAKPSFVSVLVYNMQGRVVEILHEGVSGKGQHELVWQPNSIESGLYFIVLKTPGFQATQKLMLLK